MFVREKFTSSAACQNVGGLNQIQMQTNSTDWSILNANTFFVFVFLQLPNANLFAVRQALLFGDVN